MADVQRVLHDYIPPRAYDVKGSVSIINAGDLLFYNSTYQGISQQTVQGAGAGSAGNSAANARFQFANLFVGVSHDRHDVRPTNDQILVSVDAEIDIPLANSTGVATAATAEIGPGAKVGVAVDGNFVPIADKIVVDGAHSVTVADNEAIGRTSRVVRPNEKLVRVHIKGLHVMSQVGI